MADAGLQVSEVLDDSTRDLSVLAGSVQGLSTRRSTRAA